MIGKYGIRAFKLGSLTLAWETTRETADHTNDVPEVATDGTGTVYSPEGNKLVARRSADRAIVWQSESATFASVPTITPERVLVGSEAGRKLRAYPRGRSGANPRPTAADIELDDDIVGKVTVAGEHVYCSTNQSVYCLDRASLDTVWKMSDPIDANTVTSTPVISGGSVYVATSAGIIALGE